MIRPVLAASSRDAWRFVSDPFCRVLAAGALLSVAGLGLLFADVVSGRGIVGAVMVRASGVRRRDALVPDLAVLVCWTALVGLAMRQPYRAARLRDYPCTRIQARFEAGSEALLAARLAYPSTNDRRFLVSVPRGTGSSAGREGVGGRNRRVLEVVVGVCGAPPVA